MREYVLAELSSNMFLFMPAAFIFAEYDNEILTWTSTLVVALIVTALLSVFGTALFVWHPVRTHNMPFVFMRLRFLRIFLSIQMIIQLIQGISRGMPFSDFLLAVCGMIIVRLMILWMKRVDAEAKIESLRQE